MSQTNVTGTGTFKGVAPLHKCFTKHVQHVQNRVSTHKSIDLCEPASTSYGAHRFVTNVLTQPPPSSLAQSELNCSVGGSDSQLTTLSQTSLASYSQCSYNAVPPQNWNVVPIGAAIDTVAPPPNQTTSLDTDQLRVLYGKVSEIHSKVMSQSPAVKQLQEALLKVKQTNDSYEQTAIRETIAAETRDELNTVANRIIESHTEAVNEIHKFRNELLPIFTDLRRDLCNLREELEATRLVTQAALEVRRLNSEVFEEKMTNAVLEIRNRLMQFDSNESELSPRMALVGLRNINGTKQHSVVAVTTLSGAQRSSPLVLTTPPTCKQRITIACSHSRSRSRPQSVKPLHCVNVKRRGVTKRSVGVLVKLDEKRCANHDTATPRRKVHKPKVLQRH